MKNNQQIYGRNDMVMLDQHNKIYGSLGIAENYVMKTEEGINLTLSNPKQGGFDDVLTQFNIYGHSTQETTQGLNILNPYDRETSNLTPDEGSLTGKAWEQRAFDNSWVLENLKPNTTYYASATITMNEVVENHYLYSSNKAFALWRAGNEDLPGVLLYLWGAGDTVLKIGESTSLSGMFTTPDDLTDLVMLVYTERYTENEDGTGASYISDVTFSEIMLSEVDAPYEPYTGKIPSPNPYYPQEIVSVGNGGNIGVKFTGANLLVAPIRQSSYDIYIPGYKVTKAGVTFEVLGDYSVKVTGKNDGSVEYAQANFFYLNNERPLFKAGDYYGAEIHGSYQFDTLQNANLAYAFTLETDVYLNGFYIAVTVSNGEMNEIYYPMINAGTSQLPYEPYKEPQSLAIQTPNGLPGIPVTEGGNYTDESGQQWICDEIDLARGKYVQRVWRGVFDGSEGWAGRNDGRFEVVCLPFNLSLREGLCNQLLVTRKYIPPDNSVWIGSNSNKIYINRTAFWDDSMSDYGVSKWKEHLSSAPLILMTYLDILVETDLTQEQIAEYKALYTNTLTTVISNDEQAHMKATYKATESI